jgi:hypothetical protein
MDKTTTTPPLEMEGLPKAPDINVYTTANDFKSAIHDWAAIYELAYSKLYSVSDASRPPPDPGTEPVMPPGPAEPRKKDGETRVQLSERLAEWLPSQEEWFFKEYLPWEIVRTRWYIARMTLRDWEALRRLETRQKAEFRHRVVVALLRFTITGLVTGGVVLFGLKLLA